MLSPPRYCYPHKKRSDILFNFLRNGLPRLRSHRNKKVIIVGAGISGLTAGYLLKKAGHKVIILEASNRAGGRIQTYRSLILALHPARVDLSNQKWPDKRDEP